MANTFRAAIKNSYRYPMMLVFHNAYGKVTQNNYRKKLFTGITIAALETNIIAPLQRLKNFEMTRSHEKTGKWGGYRSFLFGGSHGGVDVKRELMRGSSAVFFRQMLSWSSFLVLDAWGKEKLREHLNLQESEAIPAWYLGITASLLGVVNTALVMPFDVVQTSVQKADPLRGTLR